MKIAAPKEVFKGENRVAMTPASALELIKLGHECIVQSGAGISSRYDDKSYKEVGVKIVKSVSDLWKEADVIVKVRAPEDEELKHFREGQALVSFIWPAQSKKLLDIISSFNKTNIIGINEKANAARGCRPEGIINLS